MLVIAAFTDLKERRVPNQLLVVGLGMAVLMSLWMRSMPLSDVLMGGLVGLLVFLPFYAVSAMGAGDIKLMSVVGTFVGVKGVLVCALLTALTGGVLAVVFALARAGNQLPYALAILAGVAMYAIVSFVNPAFLNLSMQVL